MGGVEFNLGTLNLGQGLGTEDVWASHEDVQRQDEDVHVVMEGGGFKGICNHCKKTGHKEEYC